jgi:amidase
MVRSGELASRELVQASLDRIEAVDDRVNAFTLVDAEGALAAADGVGPGDTRPFAGIPIAIKDLGAAVEGLVLSQCSYLFGDYTPDYDAHVVRRLKEAGFVIVGKASSPEFGIIPVTEPRRFGPTRNPWDTDRTPGGSSGGSAAAVAAGMVPIAHGSDGGGSIRIPAACCGLVGLKPSRGRISRGPDFGDSFLVTDGVLSRTVEDTAVSLDLLSGYETGDATWAPAPAEPFVETARREPGRLRIAMVTEPPIDAPIDPICAAATQEAAELLASLGHSVEPARPPWSGAHLLPMFTAIYAPSISLGVAYGAQLAGREPTPEDVEPLTWAMWERASELTSTAYVGALSQLQANARELVTFCSAYDVVLTPALAQRPVRIGEIDSCSDDPWSDFRKSGGFTPYTAIFNVSGQPAISVPLFHGDDGLPLGVQLAGPPAREDLLMSLAAQLEEARPWADRVAPLAAS